ncbi:iron ABC transporter permease [Pokkaliibacter sp. MBI-7]|uniref:FecCD family ABC transporter permease n=1 Tax=Pokkaliibacter sp. MBI-7 TaxID=3040600 RepID=UPI00244AB740|nr:iron ABC transporter permease [Pokkaliibacter sp. MBI-7]MDH2432684.1 iron ABC transporter permease [Pokkaliibacter sp. MBI-7]
MPVTSIVSARRQRSLLTFCSAWLALLAVTVVASLLMGAGQVSPARALAVLTGNQDHDARFVVYELRGQRTLLAIIVGMALGAAGTLLQSATRNPLAEPGLLGVSAGASFAVVLAISLGASAATVHFSVAIIGAMVGCLLVLLVTQVRYVGDDPVRLVLAGAAFSAMLGAITTLMLLFDQRSADEIRFWVIGTLAGRSSVALWWSPPGILLALALMTLLVRPLAALALGEHIATGLGHHPRLIRLLTLLIVAVLVGIATAVAGPIAFIGLIVPFVARAQTGSDIRRTLWLSLLIGPTLLLLADVLSRLAVKPYELPIGVITAMIGAPVLVAVVRSRRLPTL